MNKKTKLVGYAGAFLASAGLLASTLLEEPPAPRELLDVPAEGAGVARPQQPAQPQQPARPQQRVQPQETVAQDVAQPAPTEPEDPPGPTDPEVGAEPAGELVTQLESTLRSLENFAPAAQLPDLDRLALAPLGSQASRGDELLREPATIAALGEFLAEHPLTGIIHGGGRPAALMGGRTVRSGDVLLPGVARIVSIEPRSVLLDYRGSEFTVELPPLRPRSAFSAQGDAGAAGAASGGGAPAGGGGAGPVERNQDA